VELDLSAGRIWRRLTREERLAAARQFWADPASEATPHAHAAIVKVLHVRPQAVRTVPAERKAAALASVAEPSELLAASLLVALHLGLRRALLATFLDAVGLAHDQGLLAEDGAGEPVSEDAARRGVEALLAAYPPDHVRTYLNTLYLQDHDRWQALERAAAGTEGARS
jgi:hypothetical protein